MKGGLIKSTVARNYLPRVIFPTHQALSIKMIWQKIFPMIEAQGNLLYNWGPTEFSGWLRPKKICKPCLPSSIVMKGNKVSPIPFKQQYVTVFCRDSTRTLGLSYNYRACSQQDFLQFYIQLAVAQEKKLSFELIGNFFVSCRLQDDIKTLTIKTSPLKRVNSTAKGEKKQTRRTTKKLLLIQVTQKTTRRSISRLMNS